MKNIFISSTFRDMQAERDLVQEKVLPALREEAGKYGDTVGVIDLRWGVDTSTLETAEGAAKVLTVCLDEIDRSHPYMLIFLGERYGWIPDGKLIEAAVRGREDKYTTGDFEKSVTALEIEYGALSEQYGDLSQCIVCFREPVAVKMDAEPAKIYKEQDERGRQKLRELKERIRHDLGEEDRLITYTCTWNAAKEVLQDFKCTKRLHELQENEASLKNFSISLKCLWKTYYAVGDACFDDGRLEEAFANYEKAIPCNEALFHLQETLKGKENLSKEYYDMAVLLDDFGRFSKAKGYYEKELAIRESIYEECPDDANLVKILVAHHNMAFVLSEIGNYREAQPHAEWTLQCEQARYREAPDKQNSRALATRFRNMAVVMLGMNRVSEAVAYSKAAAELQQELFRKDDSVSEGGLLARAIAAYADALLAAGETEESERWYRKAFEDGRVFLMQEEKLFNLRICVGLLEGFHKCLVKAGKAEAAEKCLKVTVKKAEELYRRTGAEEDKELLEKLQSME